MQSIANGNAHVAGSAFDDPHGGINAGAIEIGELGLCDLLELSAADGADTALCRIA